jgi:hypothetical protein
MSQPLAWFRGDSKPDKLLHTTGLDALLLAADANVLRCSGCHSPFLLLPILLSESGGSSQEGLPTIGEDTFTVICFMMHAAIACVQSNFDFTDSCHSRRKLVRRSAAVHPNVVICVGGPIA